MDLSGTTSSSSILRFNTFANARLKKKAGYNRFATERFWCDLRLLLFSNAVTALFLCPLATYTVVHSRGTERSVDGHIAFSTTHSQAHARQHTPDTPTATAGEAGELGELSPNSWCALGIPPPHPAAIR